MAVLEKYLEEAKARAVALEKEFEEEKVRTTFAKEEAVKVAEMCKHPGPLEQTPRGF